MNLSEILRECGARLAESRAATTGDLGLAATHLVELADVLGPIVAIHPDQRLRELAAAAETAAGIIKAAADAIGEPLSSAVAHAAGVRLAGWAELGLDSATTPATLLASYDERSTLGTGWAALPALELVMALDLHEASGERVDRAKLRSLAPVLQFPATA